ncbi:receptor-like protein 13 [Camellia sinensis]|uniref:receptor-like protein 13 n=1 Tax=Camellia sinensis TaxID=4442 RepID=UPI0010358AAE|nr:receptor-like protein 13 [Camellia sinensis]
MNNKEKKKEGTRQELAYLGNVETLDLSSNLISGIQGCETLSRLKKLGTLSLSDNYFNKSIILCLSSLISLKNLFLGYANLGDLFPAQELTVLENLEMPELAGCGLSSLTMQDYSHKTIGGKKLSGSIIIKKITAPYPMLRKPVSVLSTMK